MQPLRKNLLRSFALFLTASSLHADPAVLHLRVPAHQFFPDEGDAGYFSLTVGGARFGGDDGTLLQAPVLLPSGAKVVSLELDFVDADSGVSVQGSLLVCDTLLQNCTYFPTSGAGPADCLEPGYICSGTSFQDGAGSQTVDLSGDGITVDNDGSVYSLVAVTSRSVGIAGMRLGYTLSSSATAQNATFSDVPKEHPFFKFIEALYASGITAGCATNPNLFCPDQPVTRGQLAVFLAVGLGLE